MGSVWILLVAAAPQPLPVELAPPDLTPLIPLAAAPIDKPPVALPELALPDPPQVIPDLPPPPLSVDRSIPKPVAPAPGATCDSRLLRWDQLESKVDCGIARFAKNELDVAARDLDEVLRRRPDRALDRRARYWLGETYFAQGRLADADRLFAQVQQELAGDALRPYALLSGGWTALGLGDTGRAMDAFDSALGPTSASPPSVVQSARRGRAVALSMLGRHDEARQAWSVLANSLTPGVAREAQFWLGESLGRLGQYREADEHLTLFVNGGAHPLRDTARLRLAWWQDKGGRSAEAVRMYRQLLATVGVFPERDWAYFGLVQALLNADDVPGAREAVKWLQEKASPLYRPALFAMARWTVAKRPAEARRANQELLSRGLSGRERAWVLCLDAELWWAEGNRDEARTRYELARSADPAGGTGWFAAIRLAQINFEFREFGQVTKQLTALLSRPVTGEIRASALLLAGEAAYYAGDYGEAAKSFRAFTSEFKTHPALPTATISLAWAELRGGNDAEARKLFEEFARDQRDSPLAPDALLLAAELAAKSGDSATALDLFTQVSNRYAGHPRQDVARLNTAILLLRAERVNEAQLILQDLVAASQSSPLIGRAREALGVARLSAKLPSEARIDFLAARQEGGGALARLGLGTAAIALQEWDDATVALKEAKDLGTVPIGDVADYERARLAFARGQREEFKKALATLVASGRATPAVSYALVALAADSHAWDEALEAAKRLIAEYPKDGTADSALARVGIGAATDKKWKVAQDAFALLRTQYRQSPFVDATFQLALDAQIETGGYAASREALEEFARTLPSHDARLTRVWFLLARSREEAGDRPGAIEAYGRAGKDGLTGPEWTTEVRLRYARLLVDDKRWKEARAALGPIIKAGDPGIATEAAFYEGEAYRGEGNASAAVLSYMNAAYLSPESPFGRRALLMAGDSYVVLKQPDSAMIAYTKLLAQPDLPPDLAQRARAKLADLTNGNPTNGTR